MPFIINRTIFLLVVAIIVAIIARRLKLPYTVGLVIAGVGLALSHVSAGIALTHELIYDIILPPLLFEASINIHWKKLRRDLLPILTLTIGGVIISSFFVAWGMLHFLGWPWASALVFATLISATDPVAVLAMFKDTDAPPRLRLFVESESILNDGVAAVFFAVALAWATNTGAEPVTLGKIAFDLGFSVAGGLITGAIAGGAAILVAGHVTDHLVETALTTAAAYGSFLLAEHFHVSGVLAAMTAGLILGNFGILKTDDNPNPVSERGRAFILDFWEFVAFLANSLIFLLIGLRIATPFAAFSLSALFTVIVLVIMGRALSVYPLCLPFSRSRWAVSLTDQHILWWGGLRGALALALSLSLPTTFPLQSEIVIATFAVVAFSVIVQGLTMPILLRRHQSKMVKLPLS